jgi:poly(A) polymerase
LDPVQNRIIDYVGGEADLKARVLRAIGDPHARFTEDKLRMLRAARMAARFELAVDASTLRAANEMAAGIGAVSQERIAEELRKILTNRHRARGFVLLKEFGLLPHILPDVVFSELLVKELSNLPQPCSFELAFAVLHRGIGKAKAIALARRLKLSNEERDRIAWLVEHEQALEEAEAMPKSRLFPLLIQPGILELIELHRVHRKSTDASLSAFKHVESVLRTTPPEVLNPPPLLTGDDLTALGYKPGPEFKRILDAVRIAQLDGVILSRVEAVKMAEQIRKSE